MSLKHTPHWMENGRRTEGGVPEVLMEGRHKGTRANRLRFARKMSERKDRKKQIEEDEKHKALTPWQQTRKEYRDRGVAMVKRPDITPIQKQYGARRVG